MVFILFFLINIDKTIGYKFKGWTIWWYNTDSLLSAPIAVHKIQGAESAPDLRGGVG